MDEFYYDQEWEGHEHLKNGLCRKNKLFACQGQQEYQNAEYAQVCGIRLHTDQQGGKAGEQEKMPSANTQEFSPLSQIPDRTHPPEIFLPEYSGSACSMLVVYDSTRGVVDAISRVAKVVT